MNIKRGEMSAIKRGEVYLADLSSGKGSEQSGVRPILIIQNDIGNRFSPTTVALAITGQISKAKLPTHVVLEAKKYGFKKDSVVLGEQIRTIDKSRIMNTKIATLDEDTMQKVENAIRISLGMGELIPA